MWSNSKETVLQYLKTLDALESEFPKMRFIYLAAHANYVDQWTGAELARNNRMVRDYGVVRNKVLCLISMTSIPAILQVSIIQFHRRVYPVFLLVLEASLRLHEPECV
jgi:hypothetical protein